MNESTKNTNKDNGSTSNATTTPDTTWTVNKLESTADGSTRPEFLTDDQVKEIMKNINPAVNGRHLVALFLHEEGVTVASGFDPEYTMRILAESAFTVASERKYRKETAEDALTQIRRVIKKIWKKGYRVHK